MFRATMMFAAWLLGVQFSASALAADHNMIVLADPAMPLDSAWTHRKFGEPTEYKRVEIDGARYIRAIGKQSASGLYRDIAYRPATYPWLEWTWRVDKLQPSADIRTKAGDDVAAQIFLIFGQPGLFRRNVPTLAYVWTSAKLSPGEVVASPYHAGSVRSIVIQSGGQQLGKWLRERRNVIADYRLAFGKDPPEKVEIIALWTDNDQTGEPVEAYYGRIVARDR
jgi:DUF3047 family protein